MFHCASSDCVEVVNVLMESFDIWQVCGETFLYVIVNVNISVDGVDVAF